MPPAWSSWSLPALLSRSSANPVAVADYLLLQWRNPSDILSILLLVGPDIVRSAVAQLAGRFVTPVAFSFGWVAYATSALLSSVGDGHLMPTGDMDNTTVICAKTGHCRTTNSWVLGKLLRDFDDRVNLEMADEQPPLPSILLEKPASHLSTIPQKGKAWEALRISIYEFDDNPATPHGVPALDWVWYSGFAVIGIQLAIAITPWAVNGRWDTFIVTAAGNILALVGGSLPQWKREKWACPATGGSTVTITRGNGCRNAITIIGKRGVGLDLEILARGTRTARATRFTRFVTAILAVLWVLLLITVAGMHEGTWYLLSIGVLGSIQNITAGGVQRSPSALGIHINHIRTVRAPKVSDALKQVESLYPGVGTSLLDVFFPGSLRVKDPEDIEFWRAALEERLGPNKYGVRLDRLGEVPREVRREVPREGELGKSTGSEVKS